MPSGTIHVVATLNVTQRSGELRHVTPATAIPPGQATLESGRPRRRARARATAPAADVLLRVFGTGDALIAEFAAPFIPDACRDAGDDVTGSIDAFVPGAAAATRLELVLDGVVVDTFTAAGAPGAVSNVRGRAPARPRRGGPTRAAAVAGRPEADAAADADPVLSWTPAPAPAGRGTRAPARARPAGAVPAAGADTRYTVQVSVDGGTTWQTVGFALTEPQVRIDRTVLGEVETVKVRITATSGFKSVATERTMKASELG